MGLDRKLSYTEEDRNRALQTNLVEVARAMGYTPVRVGSKYSLKEMDSIRIYNERSWKRWSEKGTINAGSQIDFVMEFGNAQNVPEAIHQLLNFQGIDPVINVSNDEVKADEKKEMILPNKAESYRIAYAYLMKHRGLSKDIVDFFVNEKHILYEEKGYHNLVFLGAAPNGEIKFATKRGTGDIYGKKFKCDVEGNDKNYGINIVNPDSPVLKVFEASIDLMSYIDITGDYESNKLVLGMVEDNPLVQFLKDYSHIKEIHFCLDNDIAARKHVDGILEVVDFAGNVKSPAVPGYMEKYSKMGYACIKELAPSFDGKCKDYNEALIYLKKFCPEKVYSLNCNYKTRCR